ncbi:MAG TPA: maleylpyruvate isomerase N-terminal domain-containing protein [Acidimicrobiales bacterium]|nr:maleylpyruvate isomerase N-terminal domain-containing protein [Acidimicrobiales bacterium]
MARVTRLLRSVRQPAAPALGEWTVADVAMHLSQVWLALPALAGGERRLSLPGIWSLGQATLAAVGADPERDPAVLAGRIEERAAPYLASLAGAPAAARPWLVEGTQVSPVTLTCHLLNEMLVHGWDIATADRRPWELPAGAAAAAFEGFVVPVLQTLDPRDMVDQAAAGEGATYEVRVRGGGRHLFTFDDGGLAVGAPTGRADCVIAADPSALLLVVWGRIAQGDAVAAGRLVVSTRGGWHGPELGALLRNP